MNTVSKISIDKGVSESTVLRAIKSGALVAERIAGVWFVSDEAAVAYRPRLRHFDEWNAATAFAEARSLNVRVRGILGLLEETFDEILLRSRFRPSRDRSGWYWADQDEFLEWISSEEAKLSVQDNLRAELTETTTKSARVLIGCFLRQLGGK